MGKRKNKSQSTKDFQQEKIWRLFERLSYYYIKTEILHEEINDNLEKDELTAESHDGGFDACFKLNLAGKIRTELMEAKFRNNGQKTLALNDCAKAIIIAYNYPASHLYISTNLHFSPQAIFQIDKMKINSGLDIDKLTGKLLRDYVLTQRDELNKYFSKPHEQKFLNDFIKSYAGNCKDDDNEQNVQQSALKTDLIRVIGSKHKKYIAELTRIIPTLSRPFMIFGPAGSGKSTILTKISFNLSEYDVRRIDMNTLDTPRALFIKLLECIWNVSVECLYVGTYEEVLQILGFNKCVGNELLKAAAYALVADDKFNVYKDKYIPCLTEYISSITNNHNYNKILIFENVQKAQPIVLSFLRNLMIELTNNNIKCIAECRFPFQLENASLDESEKLEKDFRSIFYKGYKIDEMDQPDASNWIYEALRGKLNINACQSLAYVLKCNPLEINDAIRLLSSYDDDDISIINNLPVSEHEKFFMEHQIIHNSIIYKSINLFRRDEDLNRFFELAVIFNGEVPEQAIDFVFKEDAHAIIHKIESNELFSFERGYWKCHLRHLAAMKGGYDKNFVSQSRDSYIAKKIAEHLLQWPNFEQRSDAYLNALYSAAKNPETIAIPVLAYVDRLKKEFVFDKAVKIMQNYFEYAALGSSVGNSEYYIPLYLEMFDSLKELHQLNATEYSAFWIWLQDAVKNKPDFSIEKIRYRLLLWDKEFVVGNFSEAFDAVDVLYHNLRYIPNDYNDYRGQVINAYGLTLKERKSGDAALKIFRKECIAHPKSFYTKIAFYCQKSNAFLRSTPEKAIKYSEKILKVAFGKKYSYQQQLHVRVDIGMGKVLSLIKNNCYNTKVINDYLDDCLNKADHYKIFMQKGRILNLKAILHLIENDNVLAVRYLRDAVDNLSSSSANIYKWRAQFNLVSVLIAQNDTKNEVIGLLDDITNNLFNHFLGKITDDIGSASYYVMLICGLYYYRLNHHTSANELIAKLKLPEFELEYYKLKDDLNWKDKINGKVLCVNDIMVAVG